MKFAEMEKWAYDLLTLWEANVATTFVRRHENMQFLDFFARESKDVKISLYVYRATFLEEVQESEKAEKSHPDFDILAQMDIPALNLQAVTVGRIMSVINAHSFARSNGQIVIWGMKSANERIAYRIEIEEKTRDTDLDIWPAAKEAA